MPSARTHDFITVVSGAAGAPAALNSPLPDMNPPHAMVLLGAYLISGLLFSPDLDLRSSPYRRWGGLRWVWLPYRRLVPHRSWISHSLFFGPLLRVLYFAGVLALAALAALALLNLLVPLDPSGGLAHLWAQIEAWVRVHPAVIAYALAGFVLGGAAHTIADAVSTWLKRTF